MLFFQNFHCLSACWGGRVNIASTKFSTVLKAICDTQVPEAQEPQHDHLQCVHGAVPNGVGDVLHHTVVAVTRGDTLLAFVDSLSLLIWYPLC